MKHFMIFFMFGLNVVLYQFVAECQEVKFDNAPKIVPRTTEAMQHPEFWIKNIKGDPDRVIMTPEQISELNKRNRSMPREIKDINGDPYSIEKVIQSKESIGLQYNVEDPLSMKTFSGDSLRLRLKLHRDYFENRTYYDCRQMKYEDDEKNRLFEMTDPGSIPHVITPQYGILIKHTLNRVLPTHQAAYSSATSWLDMLQSTSLDVAMPVAVLHTSKDNDWYYVRSEIAFGWVPAENVAIGSPKVLRDYVTAKDFIVATTYKVPVYADKEFKSFIADIYIGSRIKLLGKTTSGYNVLMPFRKMDGTFDTVSAWVKPDARVSVGNQPFTQRTIIDTFFTLLYRPYGWADSHHEFDCCGSIRVLLRTFGIVTGRWTSFELHATDHVIAFPRKTPNEKKYELLKQCEPGICLVGNAGHINLYLGEVDGRHYVIHQGGYSYTGEDGTRLHFRRVNVNDTELEGGSNISSWTEITTLKP
ncbi:MAG TPA: SH3 domain-containing protein [Anaerolineae bacterium]|nr:SH3 domain-containing protein [Anaerolineae bacterium]